MKRAFHEIDQKSINPLSFTAEALASADISWLSEVFHRSLEVAPKVCWRFCG
jgi:hypothetical protein